MDKFNGNFVNPNFSTISGIMERFFSVPYDQFQEELNNWFSQSFETGKGKCNGESQQSLSEIQKAVDQIVKRIFERGDQISKIPVHNIRDTL